MNNIDIGKIQEKFQKRYDPINDDYFWEKININNDDFWGKINIIDSKLEMGINVPDICNSTYFFTKPISNKTTSKPSSSMLESVKSKINTKGFFINEHDLEINKLANEFSRLSLN